MRDSLNPTQITLITNDTCNLRCRTCYAWTKKDTKFLSLDEIKILLADLSDWLGKFKMEVVGGEVLLREDIGEILGFAKSLGIHISLCTNGTVLNQKNSEMLVESCDVVNLSLNSLEPRYHDYMRGFEGAHALMMEGIENLLVARREKGRDTYFNIMCILSDYNKLDVLPLFRWALEKGINGVCANSVSFPFWRDYDPLWKQKGKLWPKTLADIKAMLKVIDEISALKEETARVGNTHFQLQEMRKYFSGGVLDAEEEWSPEDEFYESQFSLHGNKWGGEMIGAIRGAATRFEENRELTLNYASNFREADGSHCKIGYHNININYLGQVAICNAMKAVGNIREDHVKNIWFGKKAQERRAEIRACERGCKVLLCNSKESE